MSFPEEQSYCFPQQLHHFTCHQPCARVLISPRLRQHLLFWGCSGSSSSSSSSHTSSGFIAILVGVNWYLIVVLICLSLRTAEVKHLFMCLLATCISSLEQCLLRSFDHFLIRSFVLSLLNWKCSLYILELVPYQIYGLQKFSPIL